MFGTDPSKLDGCTPSATPFPAGSLYASHDTTLCTSPGSQGWVIKGEHPLPGHLLSFVASKSPTPARHWRGIKAVPRLDAEGCVWGPKGLVGGLGGLVPAGNGEGGPWRPHAWLGLLSLRYTPLAQPTPPHYLPLPAGTSAAPCTVSLLSQAWPSSSAAERVVDAVCPLPASIPACAAVAPPQAQYGGSPGQRQPASFGTTPLETRRSPRLPFPLTINNNTCSSHLGWTPLPASLSSKPHPPHLSRTPHPAAFPAPAAAPPRRYFAAYGSLYPPTFLVCSPHMT